MDRALQALGPVEVGIVRLMAGAAVVGCYWYFTRQRTHLSAIQWAHIGVVALLSNTLPFVIQPYLLGQGFGHSFFGTMVALVPLATILISIPMLGLWPTRRQTVGVLGGFLCVATLMHDGSMRGMSAGLLSLAVLVPVTYAFGNTYIHWKLNDLPAEPLTALFLGLGGLMLVPLELMPGVLQQLSLAPPRPATRLADGFGLDRPAGHRRYGDDHSGFYSLDSAPRPPVRRHGHLHHPGHCPTVGPCGWRTDQRPANPCHRRRAHHGGAGPMGGGELRGEGSSPF